MSTDADVLAEELMTDEEANEAFGGREARYPKLKEARSVYEPESAALKRWRINRSAAELRHQPLDHPFIAKLQIGPDEGFCVERRGRQGHVLLWGDKAQLATKVVRVFDGNDESKGD
jgi:hypothetical protein